MANETVRIHIDRAVFESPSPTTGAALYALGGIQANHELFKEVDGNEEDQPIPRNDHEVRLHADEHLYSQREFKIFVNTREKLVAKRVLTYEEVVELAGEKVPTDPAILITVDYHRGPPKNRDGNLTAGHSVRIKNGMTFDVAKTTRS